MLDKRQTDLDKEVDLVKTRVSEIKAIREQAEKIQTDRIVALEKAAKLSQEDAKAEIIKLVEKQAEEDILVRMNKLESQGEEALEQKARDILAISIQRLASSVASDVMSTSVPALRFSPFHNYHGICLPKLRF